MGCDLLLNGHDDYKSFGGLHTGFLQGVPEFLTCCFVSVT